MFSFYIFALFFLNDNMNRLSENEIKAFEKFYGKKVSSEKLNIEGFKKAIPFDIYDGRAVGFLDDSRYDMVYPTLSAIKGSDDLSNAVIEYVGVEKKWEIEVLHVLMTFNTLYKDGVEVKPKN